MLIYKNKKIMIAKLDCQLDWIKPYSRVLEESKLRCVDEDAAREH